MAEEKEQKTGSLTQDHNFIAVRRGTNRPIAGNLGEYELGYAIKENGLYIGQPEADLPKKINITNLKDIEPETNNQNVILADKNNIFRIDKIGRVFCKTFIVEPIQGFGSAEPGSAITDPQEGQIYFQEITE